MIDGAKAIIYLSSRLGCLSDEHIKGIQIPPLIAILTTAGTGTEVTQFAVIKKESQREVLQASYLIPKSWLWPCSRNGLCYFRAVRNSLRIKFSLLELSEMFEEVIKLWRD